MTHMTLGLMTHDPLKFSNTTQEIMLFLYPSKTTETASIVSGNIEFRWYLIIFRASNALKYLSLSAEDPSILLKSSATTMILLIFRYTNPSKVFEQQESDSRHNILLVVNYGCLNYSEMTLNILL